MAVERRTVIIVADKL